MKRMPIIPWLIVPVIILLVIMVACGSAGESEVLDQDDPGVIAAEKGMCVVITTSIGVGLTFREVFDTLMDGYINSLGVEAASELMAYSVIHYCPQYVEELAEWTQS